MTKFLRTKQISSLIEEIFFEAKEGIAIVSPYLQINDNLKHIITTKTELEIYVIYGKKEDNKDIEWIQELDHVKLYFMKNLHAKCYLNESRGVITSMNLYEYSEVHNIEMGVSFSYADDEEMFVDVNEEIERIISMVENQSTDKNTTTKKKSKFSISKLAKKYKVNNNEISKRLLEKNYIDENRKLTKQGKDIGGVEKKYMGKEYLAFDEDIDLGFSS
jgi:hypothetical protein